MTRIFHTAIRLVAGAFCIFAVGAAAQTVRPLINELGNPAKGRVEYVNDGLTPLNVVLEARSFTVTETGTLTTVHSILTFTSSFRPRAFAFSRSKPTTFFTRQLGKEPAVVRAVRGIPGFNFRTAQGMNVRLELPHTVYLLPKAGLEKPDIIIDRADLDPVANKVTLEVENQGNNFGRVMETQLVYSKKKQDAPGFPVFPHSKRITGNSSDRKGGGRERPGRNLDAVSEIQDRAEARRARTGEAVTAAVATAPSSSGANAPTHQRPNPVTCAKESSGRSPSSCCLGSGGARADFSRAGRRVDHPQRRRRVGRV